MSFTIEGEVKHLESNLITHPVMAVAQLFRAFPFKKAAGSKLDDYKKTILGADLSGANPATLRAASFLLKLDYFDYENVWTYDMGNKEYQIRLKKGFMSKTRDKLKTSDTDAAIFATLVGKQMVDAAIQMLSLNTDPAINLFEKWFGGMEGSKTIAIRMGKAKASFTSLKSSVEAAACVLAVDPDYFGTPDSTVYGAAIKSETYNVVYLAPGFYRAAPKSQTQVEFLSQYRNILMFNQGQTLVHEWTHKFAKPATIDVNWSTVPTGKNPDGMTGKCYGVRDCKSIAKNAPAHAARNADNHAYFAIEAWLTQHRNGEYRDLVKWDPSIAINWSSL